MAVMTTGALVVLIFATVIDLSICGLFIYDNVKSEEKKIKKNEKE
mgnify:CR=1 FL=1